jgi:hypothetical protein
VAKPRTWVCNACDHEGKTSREHLIHIAIGRVILHRLQDVQRIKQKQLVPLFTSPGRELLPPPSAGT